MSECHTGARPSNPQGTSGRNPLRTGPLAETGPDVEKIITDIVMSYVSPSVRFLDIACRTGSHLVPLCSRIMHGVLVGIEPLSNNALVARHAVSVCERAIVVKGSTSHLPFKNDFFNIITCRMTSVSIREVFRILDTNGWFIHKGPGPDYNTEIKETFKDRYVFRSYAKFAEHDWKAVCADNAKKLGFDYFHIDEYLCYAYYDVAGLTGYLETASVVKNFDREKDAALVTGIANKNKTGKGIRISRQLYLMRARK